MSKAHSDRLREIASKARTLANHAAALRQARGQTDIGRLQARTCRAFSRLKAFSLLWLADGLSIDEHSNECLSILDRIRWAAERIEPCLFDDELIRSEILAESIRDLRDASEDLTKWADSRQNEKARAAAIHADDLGIHQADDAREPVQTSNGQAKPHDDANGSATGSQSMNSARKAKPPSANGKKQPANGHSAQPLPDIPTEPTDGEPPISRPNDDRDKWIYDQCCKGTPHKVIAAGLRKKANRRRWRLIKSEQGIRRAAENHATRNGLQLPPKRKKSGRRRA